MEEAILVVRPHPRPLIAVLGHFDAAEAARVEFLAGQMVSVLERFRYVDYPQVEDACERLADRLVTRLGVERLASAFFLPIPRGGIVVLGILSYALDLRPNQLQASPPADADLVVVDDCSLTGLRFAQFLEEWPGRRVAFAPLYSHPDLRRAIEAREPAVIACESAGDLREFADRGVEHDAWKRRWIERSDPRCFWIGRTDSLCFPWNEPTTALWNHITGQEEPGWRLGSPERCYANRLASRRRPPQVQPSPAGPLAPSPSVVFGELNGDVLAADSGSGRSVRFSGPAAEMWRAIVERGTLEGAARRLHEIYSVEVERLREDLQRFAEELRTRGFLEVAESSGHAPAGRPEASPDEQPPA